ncbi:hypothetical protein CLOM_g4237, partial [Closterium sp. NIES-68]
LAASEQLQDAHVSPLPNDDEPRQPDTESGEDRTPSQRQGGADDADVGSLSSVFGRAPLTRCLAMRRGAYANWVVRTIVTPDGVREVFGPP